jgi:2-polyprenyl-3-methyl-5-hydroxy-6-metoxy-1,4-benzoquinol methylase
MFSTDEAQHWEQLARVDPYFAVLTQSKYHTTNLDATALNEFFASGQAHARRVIETTGRLNKPPESVLDFGCGVGRIALGFAALANRVVGVDVSPTMLQLADGNAHASNITNVSWATSTSFYDGVEQYDLVHSYLVLQHIPERDGRTILTRLASRVRVDGWLVVHVPIWRDGGRLKKLLRALRSSVPGMNVLANLASGHELGAPYMQMNVYRLNPLLQALSCHGFQSFQLELEVDARVSSVLLFGQRRGAR